MRRRVVHRDDADSVSDTTEGVGDGMEPINRPDEAYPDLINEQRPRSPAPVFGNVPPRVLGNVGEMDDRAEVMCTPADVGELFAAFAKPWWIAGGWALDLFLGEQTREHSDVDVAVLRRDQAHLQEIFSGWELRFIRDQQQQAWPEGVVLDLPIHEIGALTGGEPPRRIEVLLDECAGGEWIFRRDPRVHRPLADVGVITSSGLPALAPEIVLLYKAARPTPKDHGDFHAVWPSLGGGRKAWLQAAVTLLYSGHPWL
jgi:hypothetical protein